METTYLREWTKMMVSLIRMTSHDQYDAVVQLDHQSRLMNWIEVEADSTVFSVSGHPSLNDDPCWCPLCDYHWHAVERLSPESFSMGRPIVSTVHSNSFVQEPDYSADFCTGHGSPPRGSPLLASCSHSCSTEVSCSRSDSNQSCSLFEKMNDE